MTQEDAQSKKHLPEIKEGVNALSPETGKDSAVSEASEIKDARRELHAWHAEFFYGPLPPPQILAKYGEIIPDGAERILAMAERQEEHRHQMEKAIVEAEIQQSRLGLILGFVVVMTMGIGGMVLIWHGSNVNGLAIVLTALGGLLGSFLYSVKKQEKAHKISSNNDADKEEPVKR